MRGFIGGVVRLGWDGILKKFFGEVDKYFSMGGGREIGFILGSRSTGGVGGVTIGIAEEWDGVVIWTLSGEVENCFYF
jgi:hypothetical protein